MRNYHSYITINAIPNMPQNRAGKIDSMTHYCQILNQYTLIEQLLYKTVIVFSCSLTFAIHLSVCVNADISTMTEPNNANEALLM